jgi:hypothetical protein
LKKEQLECIFAGCYGIIAKSNAAPYSLTHIAKLSDMKADIQVGESKTSSFILFG